jgi:hypothetical protein
MRTLKRNWIGLAAVLSAAFAATIVVLTALADDPQPMLGITSLGTNQFSIAIINGTSTNVYELYWTPVLNNGNYPWILIGVGSTGETNFYVDVGEWPSGFFRVSIEQFYNGVPDYELADPNNPSLGPLSITIDSPTNGSTIN